MTPPLPPGVEGHPVAPDIHTGQPEPERDGYDISEQVAAQIGEWIAERDRFRDECSKLADQVERLKADRRALDIAVTGLRRIELAWFDDGNAAADTGNHEIATVIREARATVSQLLQKIGNER